MQYNWIYLCSDPRRLAITLTTLPREMQGLNSMIVCYLSHLDRPTMADELFDVASRLSPVDIEVRDLSVFAKPACPKGLQIYYDNSKPRWALGAKLLIPLIFEPPFLYTDDDVLLGDDPFKVMGYSFGTAGNFKFFKGNKRLEPIADQMWDVFKLDTLLSPMATYDKYMQNAGVYFVEPKTFDSAEWERYLKRWIETDYFQTLDPNTHEFRRQDQRFLTCYGIKRHWDIFTKSWQRRNLLTHPRKWKMETLLKNTVFVHYCTGGHKDAWMSALEENFGVNHGLHELAK